MIRNAKSILFLKYLGFSLGPLLMLVVVGFVFIFVNQNLSRQNTERITNETLEQLHANVSTLLGELDAVSISTGTDQQLFFAVRRITSIPHLTFENNQTLRSITNSLKTTVHSRPYLSSIYYYVDNPFGIMVSTDRSFGPVRPINDRDWLDVFERRTPGSALSFLVPREIHHVELPGFRRRVLSLYRGAYRMGRLLPEGVVVLNVDLDYLERVVDKIRVFDRQTIIITDDTERVLLSVGPDANPAGFGVDSPGSVRIESFVADRADEYFVTAYRSNGSGWAYVSLVPLSDIYKIPTQMLLTSIGVFGFGSIISILLMVALSRRNFLQIGHLVDLLEDTDQFDESLLPQVHLKKAEMRENITYSLMRNFFESQLVPIKNSERRYRRKTLQLLAMQSQVSPHFLFNTLETITWKSYAFTHGPNEVTAVLEKLASILEYALTRTTETVTVGEELDVARKYLEIQQGRYQDLFAVEWDIDPSLSDATVLPMILLPLLENSIYHGLRDVGATGVITVAAHARDEDRLQIVVRDTGAGIDKKTLLSIHDRLKHDDSAVEHIGLYNTNKRIELAYGTQYGLAITSAVGEGTEVGVLLPLVFN